MDELRENCPWDKKQTLESLRHLTIEETYELSDAILEGDLNEIPCTRTRLHMDKHWGTVTEETRRRLCL